METSEKKELSFGARIGLAFKILFDPILAGKASEGVNAPEKPATPLEPPPERVHASALHLLGALQREGRLIDFLQQDVAAYSDEEVGAAARVIHTGCKKVLSQVVSLAPVRGEPEGAAVSVPVGFDAQRVRLTGNVGPNAPYKGSLTHHGWVATAVRFPKVSEALDPKVIAPAEIEVA